MRYLLMIFLFSSCALKRGPFWEVEEHDRYPASVNIYRDLENIDRDCFRTYYGELICRKGDYCHKAGSYDKDSLFSCDLMDAFQ